MLNAVEIKAIINLIHRAEVRGAEAQAVGALLNKLESQLRAKAVPVKEETDEEEVVQE